jgi:hypothetical protein
MAFNFSVWLRETARLYLRYTAVGLVGIPLTLLYALAKRADWNTSIVMPGLLLLGFFSAFFLWQRLGDWQVEPVVGQNFEACWAELMNATLQNRAAPFQQAVTILLDDDAENLKTWNHVLAPALATGEVQILEASLNNALAAQVLSLQSTETIQHLLARRRSSSMRSQTSRPNTKPEPARQRPPAWASALSGEMHHAHGLA